MACNITTGLTLGASITPSGTCLVASPGKVILFSPTTPAGTDRSAPFTVTPGKAVLIDAYNLKENLPIYVNRLVVTSDCIKGGNACDASDFRNAAGSASTIVYRERMTLGTSNKWRLLKNADDSQPSRLQLLIAVPGTYELELSDATQLLGDLEVEYMEFKVSEVGSLPDIYYGGVN